MNAAAMISQTKEADELPFYQPQGDECELFETALRRRLPLLIKGPTGCGKTRFVAHMAARLGLPLETDGMRYPVWTSPATIALPLGATVEWKLTASYGDAASVRWERGPNRRAFVQPAALVASDALSLNGEWR